MAARSVQISLEDDLLTQIDRHTEARKHGRSAFIRKAVRLYLELERRREIDAAYERAYGGKADQVFEEFADLLGAQTWPEP